MVNGRRWKAWAARRSPWPKLRGRSTPGSRRSRRGSRLWRTWQGWAWRCQAGQGAARLGYAMHRTARILKNDFASRRTRLGPLVQTSPRQADIEQLPQDRDAGGSAVEASDQIPLPAVRGAADQRDDG